MGNINFQVEETILPSGGFARTPVPAGFYTMIVRNSEVKDTKSGTGQYLELEMEIVDGEHSGRRHWERLNISNPNAKAEQIAKQNLSRLCSALDIKHLTDSAQLHDRPFVAELQIDKKEPDRNRVMMYGKAGSAPVSAAPAPSTASRRPWERGNG